MGAALIESLLHSCSWLGERQAQRQPDHADTRLRALKQRYKSQFSSLVSSLACTDSQLFSMPGIGRASPLRYDSFKCTEVQFADSQALVGRFVARRRTDFSKDFMLGVVLVPH